MNGFLADAFVGVGLKFGAAVVGEFLPGVGDFPVGGEVVGVNDLGVLEQFVQLVEAGAVELIGEAGDGVGAGFGFGVPDGEEELSPFRFVPDAVGVEGSEAVNLNGFLAIDVQMKFAGVAINDDDESDIGPFGLSFG